MSLLKWAGSKKSLVKEVIPYFNHDLPYIELMFGSGHVFFEYKPRHVYFLNDYSRPVINFWRQVRANTVELHEKILELFTDTSDEAYYRIRSRINDTGGTLLEHAAWFYYINRVGYKGLWRMNQAGKVNTPYGHYKNPKPGTFPHFCEAAHALPQAGLTTKDFSNIFVCPPCNIYIDPPYPGGFVQYTSKGFGHEDHLRLASYFFDMREHGHRVVLSLPDTEYVRTLYYGAQMDEVVAGDTIGHGTSKKRKRKELIIT